MRHFWTSLSYLFSISFLIYSICQWAHSKRRLFLSFFTLRSIVSDPPSLLLLLFLFLFLFLLFARRFIKLSFSFIIFSFLLQFSVAGIGPWNLHHELSMCMHICMHLFMHACKCSELLFSIIRYYLQVLAAVQVYMYEICIMKCQHACTFACTCSCMHANVLKLLFSVITYRFLLQFRCICMKFA